MGLIIIVLITNLDSRFQRMAAASTLAYSGDWLSRQHRPYVSQANTYNILYIYLSFQRRVCCHV